MKSINRFICMALAVLLWVSPAQAQGAARAAALVEAAQFAHYPSYEEEGSLWRVNALSADAMLDRFWAAAKKQRSEMCAFHLAVEGNVQTGVWSPVLKLYYVHGPRPVNARAVSLVAAGMRCDLAASSQQVAHGRIRAEVVTAPLTHQATQALQALAGEENLSLRLLGEEIYTASITLHGKTERDVIQGASLAGLKDGLALLETAGLASYALWDLSAAAWESRYGFAPAFAACPVANTLRGAVVNDPFGMVLPGDSGDAARAAQALLAEYGFLSERESRQFSLQAAQAARRAQRYLGLIETGCVDAPLEAALAAGRSAQEQVVPTLHTLGETAAVALSRFWFARAVSASANEESTCTVHNSDNLLLVADGFIRSLAQRQLHLFMQLEALVIANGQTAFPAELVCQTNQGAQLDTLLLPLAQSRLIVYAEVPAYLAQDPSITWTVQLTADGHNLEFLLQ